MLNSRMMTACAKQENQPFDMSDDSTTTSEASRVSESERSEAMSVQETEAMEPPHKEPDNNAYYQHHPSFLRLFRYEFDHLLEDDIFRRQLSKRLSAVLNERLMKPIHANLDPDAGQLNDAQKKQIFMSLRSVENRCAEFWEWFQKQLIKYAEELSDPALQLMLAGPPELEKEHFDLFFDEKLPLKIDWLTDMIMPAEFIEALAKFNIEEYNRIIETAIQPCLHEKPRDYHYVACEILRRMFYANPGVVNDRQRSWYMDFLRACLPCTRNYTFLKLIDKDFNERLDQYAKHLKTLKPNELIDTKDLVDPEEVRNMKFRPPPSAPTSLFIPVDAEVQPSSLNLRSYQTELARYAKEGVNTVICAPTGSGKTIVAIDIIRSHLLRRNFDSDGTMHERSRVVFVVPTVPLVAQQKALIAQYLGTQFTVDGFSGANPPDDPSRRNFREGSGAILDAHIVVITPQMLVNLLQNVNRKRRLYVSDFTLFVLDECHHTDLMHPYEVLMKIVRNYVESERGKREVPQVVGLTASLGTKKQLYDPFRTEQHILSLCVRMLATHISTVRSKENLDELRRHVNLPVDEVCRAKRPLEDKFRSALKKRVDATVDFIRDIVEEEVKPRVKALEEFQFTQSDEPRFRSAIERLYESTPKWPDELGAQREFVIGVIDYLRVYLHGMKINELMPAAFAYNYMKEKFDALFHATRKKEQFRALDKIYLDGKQELLLTAKEDTGRQKEVLMNFIGMLDAAYKANRDTLTLIFVETRNYTRFLAEFLNNSNTMKKYRESGKPIAGYLTSTNQSQKEGGMSVIDQRDTIQKFEKGILKILVVTSVAEEGLDISACNLIIKYNTVGSERTMIQRRGRARAYDSRSILICLDDEIEQREIANIVREQMMHQCLQNLQSKSKRQLEEMIAEMRDKINTEEKRIEAETRNRDHALEDKVYELLCAKCYHVICTSRDIRSVLETYYCCVAPHIWSRIKIGYSDKPGIEQHVTRCSQFKCMKCDAMLGSVILFAGVFLPAVTAGNIAFQEKALVTTSLNPRNRERITQKSWTYMRENLFPVLPINDEHMRSMANALNAYSQQDHEQMALQAAYAAERHKEIMNKRREKMTRFNLEEFDDDGADGY